MGQFENAVAYIYDALELESSDYIALILIAAILIELGNYDEAIKLLEKSSNSCYNLESLAMIACAYARAGEKDKAYKIITQIELQSKVNCLHSIKLSRIYIDLGEKETAYKLLEQAFEEHEVDLLALNSDPRWRSISDEPRFRELVFKVGLSI